MIGIAPILLLVIGQATLCQDGLVLQPIEERQQKDTLQIKLLENNCLIWLWQREGKDAFRAVNDKATFLLVEMMTHRKGSKGC